MNPEPSTSAGTVATLAEPSCTLDLLCRVFASEVGLAPELSPAAQFNGVIRAYAGLRQGALTRLERREAAALRVPAGDGSVQDVNISAEDDAMAFATLYRGIETFFGGAVERPDEYSVCAALEYCVYPIAAKFLFSAPSVQMPLLRALRNRLAQQSPSEAQETRNLLANTFRCEARVLQKLCEPRCEHPEAL